MDENSYVPDVVPEEELEYFRKGNYGGRVGWGRSPAVLVVDMTKQFTSDAYALGRSDTAEDPVAATARLVDTARESEVPLFYTRNVDERCNVEAHRGMWTEKLDPHSVYDPGEGNEINPELEPTEADVVVEKPKASAFFDTHLGNILRWKDVDTVVVAGVSTSGCVRASVVDSFSHNFRTIVPIECVGDRSETAHEMSLFDMDMKYADVLPLADVTDHLQSM